MFIMYSKVLEGKNGVYFSTLCILAWVSDMDQWITWELVLLGGHDFPLVFDPDTDFGQGQHGKHHYYALGQQGQLKVAAKPKTSNNNHGQLEQSGLSETTLAKP